MTKILIESDEKRTKQIKSTFLSLGTISGLVSITASSYLLNTPNLDQFTVFGMSAIAASSIFPAIRCIKNANLYQPSYLEIDTEEKKFLTQPFNANNIVYQGRYEEILDTDILYKSKNYGLVSICLLAENKDKKHKKVSERKYTRNNFYIYPVKNPMSTIEELIPHTKDYNKI